ncbi:THO complex subunit 6 homolog isoform X2 [Archocentrus centrarchus]|uniref:THO complex subunit 6 homolog isoform X2 n=1 Tax=Archocentrus centrarchus TaxID=63155 RepID=UPI0011EA0CE0|nr:THO complex subunit 6 homolog isoform X2 [Archocentrus centrarchus]
MGPVELLHMSVFSQSFSPCGRFLAAGNNYGEIAVFSLSAALSPDVTDLNQKPILTFTAHEGPVFALLSTDCHLLSAGNGEISAWSWSELTKKNVKPLWTRRPNYKSSLEIPEINSMTINPRDNSLIIGGGDNNIHVMDLENGAFKAVLQGHSDYIHCVTVREREAEILSGGEDGAVRMWDSRTGQCVHCIEVYKYEVCARPQFGKWISCVTTDSDWTSIFNLSGCQRQAAFHQDMILAVGEGAFVSHCLLGGEVKAQIPCTAQSLNTLQFNSNSTEHRVLTVGGSNNNIDVFTNLSYRAFSLSF